MFSKLVTRTSYEFVTVKVYSKYLVLLISNCWFSMTTEPILIIFGALDQEKFTPSNKLISEEKGAVLKMT